MKKIIQLVASVPMERFPKSPQSFPKLSEHLTIQLVRWYLSIFS